MLAKETVKQAKTINRHPSTGSSRIGTTMEFPT